MSQLPQFQQANPYPQAGDVLDGKYRVERLLGEGGMGAVAKATHLLRRAPVALKFMSPAVLALQGAVERFVNEGVAASQIDSDHVVKVFDVGRMPNGAPYLVMEFLDGLDLGQLLHRDGGRLSVARTVHFAVQILRALQTAHDAGIIHRDMKPSNCFVIEKDGEPDFVKLVDFGISKVRTDDANGQSANLTRTNSALGTPLYMSPEQARSPRDVDHRADLYSVGAILYELLAGRTPYTASSGEYTEILFKIFTTDPDPLLGLRPDVPEGLAAVVHRALSRDLHVRYGSAAEMAEALAPFADERSAATLARLRGIRGRSIVPAPSPGAPAVSTHAPPMSGKDAATAATFPGTPNAALPKVSTEPGMTREASGAKEGRKGSRILPLAIGGALLVGLGVGSVVVIQRGHTPAAVTSDPSPPPSTVVAPAPPPPVTDTSPVAPAVSLVAPEETLSASTAASTHPPASVSGKPAASGKPAPAAAPSSPPKPGGLQGINANKLQ